MSLRPDFKTIVNKIEGIKLGSTQESRAKKVRVEKINSFYIKLKFEPKGLCCVGKRIFVGDFKGKKVCVFDENGIQIKTFICKQKPLDLAANTITDNIFVLQQDGIVTKYDTEGEELARAVTTSTSCNLCVDTHGNLFISDYDKGKVMMYDNKLGYIKDFGGEKSGTLSFELKGPAAIAVDRDDKLFVCDITNDRVQVFDVKSGGHFKSIGEGQFPEPLSILIDGQERVVVSSLEDENRVQWMTRGGTILGDFSGAGLLAQWDLSTVILASKEHQRIIKLQVTELNN